MKLSLPRFSSPLVIRPHAKQRIYLLCSYFPFLGLTVFNAVYAVASGASPLLLIPEILMLAVSSWLVVSYCRNAAKDVTAFLPPVIAVGAVQILRSLLLFFTSLPDASVFTLLLECVGWAALVFSIVSAVCGRMKLIVPMLLMLFGFFYIFIQNDLRSVLVILARICLYLMLWFPVDSVVFTTLYDEKYKQ